MKPSDPRPRCKATARSGDQCRNAALAGKTTCRYHGGLGGGDGRPPQHYVYSRHLKNPADLEAYEHHLANPDLLSLGGDIALARTNLGRFLDSLEGALISAEVREHINKHLDLISKLTEREAKRLYQNSVVEELIAKQVAAEAAILQKVLSQYVDSATAERAANEFATLVNETTGTGGSVQIGG